jgi:hypothetical protein
MGAVFVRRPNTLHRERRLPHGRIRSDFRSPSPHSERVLRLCWDDQRQDDISARQLSPEPKGTTGLYHIPIPFVHWEWVRNGGRSWRLRYRRRGLRKMEVREIVGVCPPCTVRNVKYVCEFILLYAFHTAEYYRILWPIPQKISPPGRSSLRHFGRTLSVRLGYSRSDGES